MAAGRTKPDEILTGISEFHEIAVDRSDPHEHECRYGKDRLKQGIAFPVVVFDSTREEMLVRYI